MMEAHAAYRAWGGNAEPNVHLGGEQELPPLMHSMAPAPAALEERAPVDHSQRDAMILEELPQVHFIASRMLERLPPSVQLEDLVNAGVLGLLEAYESYSSERNAQFRTFARFRIRGAMLDSLRSLDWGSRGLRRRARDINDAAKRLEAELGRTPEREELADALGMTVARLEAARNEIDNLQIVGQQKTVGDSEDTLDLIESAPSDWENPFELYAKSEAKAQLAAAVAALSKREQTVLSLYYRDELTMKQVSEVVGIAVSRVSQIHSAALSKLRAALGPPPPAPEPPQGKPKPKPWKRLGASDAERSVAHAG